MSQTTLQSGWKEVRLGDYIGVKHGFAFKGEFFTEEENENILLTPGNFKIGGGFKSDKFKFYNGEIPNEYVLKENDLIVSMTDLSKDGDTLGYSAKIPVSKDKKYLHNQRLGLVQFRSELLDRDFLYYLMSTRDYQKSIVNSSSGSTVRHTSPTKILHYQFPLPPLPTQRTIATILSAFDDKIELLRAQNKTLENIAETIFKEWFVRFRFPGYEKTKMAESELGQIPEGWRVKPLGHVTELIIDHRGKTPKKLGGDWRNYGIPALSARNVKNGEINMENIKYVDSSTYTKWMKEELKAGDILLTSEGPLGELFFLASQEKYCLSQRLFALRTNSKFVSPEYLYLWLYSAQGQSLIKSRGTGSTVKGIRQSELRKIMVLLPPPDILIRIKDLLQYVFKSRRNNYFQALILTQLRDALLPRLMRGEGEMGT